MYTGIKFEPVYSRRNYPETKKDKTIRELKYWVAVLATADIIYTILTVMVIYNGGLK